MSNKQNIAQETSKDVKNVEQTNEALIKQIEALTKKIADLETSKDVKNKEIQVVRGALPPLASIELKVTNY